MAHRVHSPFFISSSEVEALTARCPVQYRPLQAPGPESLHVQEEILQISPAERSGLHAVRRAQNVVTG